jgi:hypothetical protein
MPIRLPLLVVLLAVCGLLLACGGGDDPKPPQPTTLSALEFVPEGIVVEGPFCDNVNRVEVALRMTGSGEEDFTIVTVRQNVTQNAEPISAPMTVSAKDLNASIPLRFGRGPNPYNANDVMELYAYWEANPTIATLRYRFNCSTGEYSAQPAP